MTKLVKWGYSDWGLLESKCRKYDIQPDYCGGVIPRAYQTSYYRRTLDGYNGSGYRRKLSHRANTQEECKAIAEKHAQMVSLWKKP